MAVLKSKTHKVQAYYIDSTRIGKFESICRRFIHKENGGFWAAIRDLSMREIVELAAVNIQNTIVFEVNFNKKFIEKWQDLIILFEGKTFKISAKPDEFDYVQNKGSLKIQAMQFTDNNMYSKDIYEV